LAAIRLGREIQPVGPPRGAARQVKNLSAISPDAEICPYRRSIDLQAGRARATAAFENARRPVQQPLLPV